MLGALWSRSTLVATFSDKILVYSFCKNAYRRRKGRLCKGNSASVGSDSCHWIYTFYSSSSRSGLWCGVLNFIIIKKLRKVKLCNVCFSERTVVKMHVDVETRMRCFVFYVWEKNGLVSNRGSRGGSRLMRIWTVCSKCFFFVGGKHGCYNLSS